MTDGATSAARVQHLGHRKVAQPECVGHAGTQQRAQIHPDEARGRQKTRRVVIAHQVVVDGLGNVQAAQRVAGLVGLQAY